MNGSNNFDPNSIWQGDIMIIYGFKNGIRREELDIPEGARIIGEGAFMGQTQLKRVKIPASVQLIAKDAFRGSGVETVIFCGDMDTIGANAFRDCKALKRIRLPENVRYISKNAFRGSGLVSAVLPKNSRRVNFGMFRDCTELRSVMLPDDLEYIMGQAFCGCTSLEKISLPESTKYIGIRAFMDSGINEVRVNGAQLEMIDKRAFYRCGKLENIDIGQNIQVIGALAFAESGLNDITLHESMRYIGAGAFMETYIGEISIPHKISLIYPYTFRSCRNLRKAHLTDSVYLICQSAFDDCSSLCEVNIPDYLDELGAYAFRGCDLCEINLPVIKKGREIGEMCFLANPWLDKLNIPVGHTVIDMDKLTECRPKEISISEGVKCLIFRGKNYNLEKLDIPESADYIDIDLREYENMERISMSARYYMDIENRGMDIGNREYIAEICGAEVKLSKSMTALDRVYELASAVCHDSENDMLRNAVSPYIYRYTVPLLRRYIDECNIQNAKNITEIYLDIDIAYLISALRYAAERKCNDIYNLLADICCKKYNIADVCDIYPLYDDICADDIEDMSAAAEIPEIDIEKLPRILFKISAEKTGIYDSKIGGTPYFPRYMVYPTGRDGAFAGEPLILLAQLNFGQLPHIDDFPEKGILQFFIAPDDMYGMSDDYISQKNFRVIYHSDPISDMARLYTEADLPRPSAYDPDDLPFRGEYKLIPEQPDMMGVTELDFRLTQALEDIDEDPEDIASSVKDTSGIGRAYIGGYPVFTQQDPRYDLDDLSDCDILLFEIDSITDDENIDIMWGDDGTGSFHIPLERLRKLDFSRVLYNYDCC